MKPTSSETTGQPRAAPRQPSAIGQQLGEPGSATRSATVPVAALQAADPAETDKALLLHLKHSLGQPVSIRTRWVDPEAGESYEVFQGVDWPPMSLEQARAALAIIEAASAPAARPTLGALLAKLWLATAKQHTTSDDQEGLAGVYISELRTWPGDIAQAVLRRARRQCRWWPPLADLCRECASLARQRVWLRTSLEDRIAELQRPPAPVPTVRPMPSSANAAAAQKPGHVSWSPGSGNVERLARHLDITPRQAWVRLLEASADEIADYELVVRQLAAAEGRGEASLSEG